MNVLIIGSGGREHAIAWKISKSSMIKKLIVCPGNAGTELIAQNIELDINDFKIFWWPKWTPSKVPIVTIEGSFNRTLNKSLKTIISYSYYY